MMSRSALRVIVLEPLTVLQSQTGTPLSPFAMAIFVVAVFSARRSTTTALRPMTTPASRSTAAQ